MEKEKEGLSLMNKKGYPIINTYVYKTIYYHATSNRGARIKVIDTKKDESIFIDYNYALSGIELHISAVISAAWQMNKHGIQYDNLIYGGSHDKGYYIVELLDYTF